MFTITRAAAKRIRSDALVDDRVELALRVAAERAPDGGIEYRMGFDEVTARDILLSTNGVDVVLSQADKALLNGTVLDYVEIESGEYRFIFLNPNDPHYRAPSE
ncbi:HesB/IscA family protein [Thioalkalivibrio sp. HK1]|uniref:HesB/IscA family protein n=1 Tax=Thioalkalivibrio sp. HK1 TaxID=1469245 RepID=UPI0004712203|nr:iron-sulfur cluster biosynthesis family protein [Thioalkalivibrio sp. HK1]